MDSTHKGLDDCFNIDSGEMENIVNNSMFDSGDINRLIAAADLQNVNGMGQDLQSIQNSMGQDLQSIQNGMGQSLQSIQNGVAQNLQSIQPTMGQESQGMQLDMGQNSTAHFNNQRQPSAATGPSPVAPSTSVPPSNIRRPGSRGTTSKKDKPYIEIIEQPRSRGLRFRYTCEGRSAGSIPGSSSTSEKKTFPAIKHKVKACEGRFAYGKCKTGIKQIHNYTGPAVVVVSCVTNDSPKPKPHPHTLVGKDCTQGVCNVKVRDMSVVTFPHIGIQCARKNDVKEQMEQRKKINVDPYQTGFGNLKDIDLKIVKLCFQVFLPGPGGTFTHIVPPVCSNAILDKKAHNELVITRIDHTSGRARGGDEVFLLCEKVTKDDIEVRFFEMENDQMIWEDFADFGSGDVHRQFAIVFRTPPYKDPSIRSPQQVLLQLHRKSDEEVSETIVFTYMPEDPDPHQIEEKRKRKCQQFSSKLLNDGDSVPSSAEVKERIKLTAARKLKIKEEKNPTEVGCEVLAHRQLERLANGGFQTAASVNYSAAPPSQLHNLQAAGGVDYQMSSMPDNQASNQYMMSSSSQTNPVITDVHFNPPSGQLDMNLLSLFLNDNLANDAADMLSVNLSGDILSSNFEVTPLDSMPSDMVDHNPT